MTACSSTHLSAGEDFFESLNPSSLKVVTAMVEP